MSEGLSQSMPWWGGCTMVTDQECIRIAPWGELDLAVEERLHQTVDALVALGAGHSVEVDLRAVTLLGSSAMRWLVRLRSVVADAGGEMTVVVDAGGHAAHVLDLIGLDDSLPIRERPHRSRSTSGPTHRTREGRPRRRRRFMA